jgi:mycothiol system anti-sigma-R factor
VAEGVAGEEAGGGAPAGPREVDCDEAVHQLYHYLDGELTDERRRVISLHLDECRPCADAAGFEAELRSVIANRCRDRVPEDLKARIAAALHEEAVAHSDARRPDATAKGGGAQ